MLLMIMLSMENMHARMEERVDAPIVVSVTMKFKMLEEDESMQKTVEVKETCSKGTQYLHTLPKKGHFIAQCWKLKGIKILAKI